MSFSTNLQKLREKNGKTRKQMSEEIGVSLSAYTNYEAGNRAPNVSTLPKIAAALNVSTDELLEFTPNETEYWLDKFPQLPLFADRDGDNVIISAMQDGRETVKLATLSKEEFVDIMEQIKERTKEETRDNYGRMFKLLTLEHFLDRALWGDYRKL